MKKFLFFIAATIVVAIGCEEPNVLTGKVTTQPASGITKQSAVLNGTIEVSEGNGGGITQRGFVLGTSPGNLSIEVADTKGGDGTFTCTANDLTPNTKYYVKAYAGFGGNNNYYGDGGQGSTSHYEDRHLVFGSVIEFTTMDGTLATSVTTQAASDITENSATLNGTIVNEGYPAYSERGFVYGTAENPTVVNTKKVVAGSGRGTFSSTLTNLTGLTFYVRAYVIQNGEPVYGDQITFKLNVPYTELLGGLVVDGTDISESQIAYSSASSLCENSTRGGFTDWRLPTKDELTTIYTNRVEVGGFQSSRYWSSTIANSYYYYYISFNGGAADYGSYNSSYARCVRKEAARELPAVQTSAATNVNANGATVGGKITKQGYPVYTERGVCYSQSNATPTISDTKVAVAGSDTTFATAITGLTQGIICYVRAYATNSEGTAYGSVQTFTPALLASLIIQAASNITDNSADVGATVISDGAPAYSERGFCYATTANPTISNSTKIVSGTGLGSFTATLTGLSVGTTYYVRAYAISGAGVGYSTEVNFTTTAPLFVTLPVVNLMIQKTDIGTGSWSTINSLCENSIVAGYTDWRLPTQSELATMYGERTAIGGFTTTSGSISYYWTSTYYNGGYSNSGYYYQSFYNGSQNYVSGSYKGRCVRTTP